ncbi:urease accessory protein UreF [Kribbella kalugense]|uniref:Urease accessory protein UreF n=1 Tax=Kribbella kalugense TaxID=2512221 RepID=A0A4R7ZX05_9ACTN|nr:urease accessory UreF family protein [Kribbella kalugense]TDW22619.1 urease accessory protein [Kribbella kalugense]
MSTAELVALMLTDGRLPTGGHTQSAGLEPAVRAGLGADGKQLADVTTYARDRLHTVTRVEAAVAVLARYITHSHQSEGLRLVEGAWAARTSSQVLRGVSRRQGRAYLRLAGRVWPEVLEHLQADSEVPRPIVIGVIGAVTGLSAEQVARIIAYDDVQSVVSASLKLLPVDPAEAATWLAGLHDDIEELVADVSPLTDIEKIPANGAPLIDQFAQNHATERMRLFHA